MAAMLGIWLPTAVATVGLVLLALGMKGRRIGSEPRCRKCAYDLRGSEERPCPECGEPHRTHRIGVRKRRRAVLVIGLTLLTTGGLGLTNSAYRRWLAGLDYYTLMPSRLLLSWVEKNEDMHAADILAQRWRAGGLSDERAAALFRSLFPASAHTRPHREEDDFVQMCLAVRSITLEKNNYRVYQQWIPLGLKGLRVEMIRRPPNNAALPSSPNTLPGGVSPWGFWFERISDRPTGDVELTGVVEFTVSVPDGSREVSWKVDLTVTSELVVTDDPWPGLERLSGAEYDQAIVEEMMWLARPAPDSSGPSVRLNHRFVAAPAFPVVALVRIRVGDQILGSSRTLDERFRNLPGPRDGVWIREMLRLGDILACVPQNHQPGEAELILTSDLKRAWERPSFDRVWDGELRFRIEITRDNVYVLERLPARPP